jgi:D-threo-aldose 1-dehydrogenase
MIPELPLKQKNRFGKTGLELPPVVFGTSALGNLYRELSFDIKLSIVSEMFDNVDGVVVMDSAGKYGAGLALEVMGAAMEELNISPERVVVSNKLGWKRTELRTPEPTFEPGAWVGLKYDAVQRISYDGIFECYEQGCELIGDKYSPALVSVHDPDEYIAQALNERDRERLMDDVIGAYRALAELKAQGVVKAVGIGSKDWRVIREVSERVSLDWVMFANSFTILRHPPELLSFIEELHSADIGIVNSAVFHAGFLTGGEFFDYVRIKPDSEENKKLFAWRDRFWELCRKFEVLPSVACVQFGLMAPGVSAVSLNTARPERVRENVLSVATIVPPEFWETMRSERLIL